MELEILRKQIDAIDDQIVSLFCQRMSVAAQIADYKKEKGLPVFMPLREQEKILDVSHKAGPEMENYTRALYALLFELSRNYQNERNQTS